MNLLWALIALIVAGTSIMASAQTTTPELCSGVSEPQQRLDCLGKGVFQQERKGGGSNPSRVRLMSFIASSSVDGRTILRSRSARPEPLVRIDALQNARSHKDRLSRGESIMDVVVRTYSGKGAKELFSLLEERKSEIEELLRSTTGFVSYTLARSSESDGGLSMTVCEDKAGIEESVRMAKEWIAQNAAHIGADAPKVSLGTIIIHATK
ncbi:hypothetical protein [Phyllobacterium sophorae]|nr:hypothetical protein [Phyllobacterium sophorae]